jgi:hypothetical protein
VRVASAHATLWALTDGPYVAAFTCLRAYAPWVLSQRHLRHSSSAASTLPQAAATSLHLFSYVVPLHSIPGAPVVTGSLPLYIIQVAEHLKHFLAIATRHPVLLWCLDVSLFLLPTESHSFLFRLLRNIPPRSSLTLAYVTICYHRREKTHTSHATLNPPPPSSPTSRFRPTLQPNGSRW